MKVNLCDSCPCQQQEYADCQLEYNITDKFIGDEYITYSVDCKLISIQTTEGEIKPEQIEVEL